MLAPRATYKSWDDKCPKHLWDFHTSHKPITGYSGTQQNPSVLILL